MRLCSVCCTIFFQIANNTRGKSKIKAVHFGPI